MHTEEAGGQIGDTYWELYCLEHSIQSNGEFLFTESDVSSSKFLLDFGTMKRVPRSILVYQGPTVIGKYVLYFFLSRVK